jgi:hypothetical protein
MNNTLEIEKPTLRDVFYHRARLQNNIYHDVLERFAEMAEESGFTKKQLAVASGKDAAQITRLFAEPGNWTLATVSDLLLAMGAQLDHSVVLIRPQESNHIEIATEQPPVIFTETFYENPPSTLPQTYSYAS